MLDCQGIDTDMHVLDLDRDLCIFCRKLDMLDVSGSNVAVEPC
jgi:hypothetical protein